MRHANNRQNTPLIFELLTQQIVSNLAQKNNAIGARKSLYLIKKYFKKGTALHEELKLANTILYNEVDKWGTASRLLTEVLKEAKGLDERKLKHEKYHLIQEIKANFDQSFWKAYIPNYKIYSSLWTLMENARNKKVAVYDKVILEEQVCKHLLQNTEVARINRFLHETKENHEEIKDIDEVTMRFIVKKFNDKYAKVLNPIQKQIVNEYIRSTSNRAFDQFANKITKKFENELYESFKHVKDKSLVKRIYEAFEKLPDVFKAKTRQEKAKTLMTYAQLIDELNKLRAEQSG